MHILGELLGAVGSVVLRRHAAVWSIEIHLVKLVEGGMLKSGLQKSEIDIGLEHSEEAENKALGRGNSQVVQIDSSALGLAR